ncbi:MAG: sulfatase [Candidatus Sulfotelmatobacter sp.]
MDASNTVDSPPIVDSVEQSDQPSEMLLRSWSLLASMAAFFCLIVEVELLEHIDSLSLYLTYSEIGIVAGIALVMLLCAALGCWLSVLSLTQAAAVMPALKPHRVALAWHLGLGVGICYFVLEIVGAGKLLAPQWKPSILSQVLIVIALAALCVYGMSRGSTRRLQHFGMSRLVPIFLVHFALAVVTLIVLLSDGTRLFHDYAPPGHLTAAQSPDIYLITIDALSAEHISLYGYGRPTTPNLERFAQRSFTFDNVIANSNFTTPGTASIATGKLPWSHRVFHFSGFLRGEAEHETLSRLLRQRGYYTAMFSSNYAATPILRRTLPDYDAVEYVPPKGLGGYWFRLTNFIGSKHQYVLDAALPNRVGLVKFVSDIDALIWPFRYPSPAEPVFDRARALIERSDITQPRFVWAHILPPHDPYLPPPPYRDRFSSGKAGLSFRDLLDMQHEKALPRSVSPSELRARYDEMVLYADNVVDHFIDWLDQTGRLDRAIVIVSADHGESFEHGWYFHGGSNLDQGVIHIPLLIHLPGEQKPGRITQLAQQADLLPTVMDLIGGEIPSWTDGASLKPVLDGKTLPERYIFSMNLERDRIFDPISKGIFAVFDDEFKYVICLENHQEWLYQYKTDRLEEHNLMTSEPDVARRLHDVLFAKLAEVNKAANSDSLK